MILNNVKDFVIKTVEKRKYKLIEILIVYKLIQPFKKNIESKYM